MYLVSLGAVRRRTGQSLMVLILAAFAAAVAAAGPWYGLAVATGATGADVAAAPAAQRVITVHRTGETGGDPRAALDTLDATVQGLLPLPGVTPVLGLAADMTYPDPGRAGAPTGLPIAYRDGFCAQVRLTGTCPASATEIALSKAAAQNIHKKAGDTFEIRPTTSVTPLRVRVVGIFEKLDPAGTYWTDPVFLARADLDPAFTTLDAFRQPQLAKATLSSALPVPDGLLRGDNRYDLGAALAAAEPSFAAGRLELIDPTGPLLEATRTSRATVSRGVLVPLGQVLVLAWFAIGLAGRFTGRDRRADAGLLKLRGSGSGGMLRLAFGQHLVPLLGGALAGWPAGIAAALLLAGPPVRTELWPALLLSAGAVALVLLGGLVVLTVLDALTYRAPVAVLLRRVPSARSDWRSLVADLAVVALAAGAVYQARSGGPASGLGAVAPALVALAFGLLLARLLRRLADRAGGVAVRAGRLRSGLTAVQISRQPGTDRVFALVVAAVAMLALALGSLHAGRADRAVRAELELGAPRVLTVSAASRTQLEYAVRRADPGGRHAMAAAVDTMSNPPVLAVDSTRLAAVATWRPDYGPRPVFTPPADQPLITGTGLSLRVANARDQPATVGVTLLHDGTGAVTRLEFQNIRPGEQTVTVPVAGCTTAPGCRLIAWQLFASPGPDGRPLTQPLTIRGLTQQNPAGTVLDAARLGDVTRWHTDFAGLGVRVTTREGGLVLAAGDRPGQSAGTGVYPVGVPLPLPVVLAGPAPSTWRFDDALAAGFGATAVPVEVVGTPPLLPVLGGHGLLVDLDAARQLAGDAGPAGALQVWLSADAPAGLPDALRREGLTVLDDQTTAGRAAELAAAGPVITRWFAMFAAVVALLLAAAMVAVAATVERGPLADQLRALRTQGLARPVALVTAYAGSAALVLAGLLGGLLAALVARPLAAVTAPPFTDGWRVVPPPGALGPAALALTAAAGLLVLGTTAGLSALPLVRRVTGAGR